MQTIHAPRVAPLDPQRIAASSGACAINGLLRGLLVAPMSAPVVVEAARDPYIVPIRIDEKIVPPPPKQPERVAVTRQQPAPQPQPQVQKQDKPVDPPLAQEQAEPGDSVAPPNDGRAVPDGAGGVVLPPDDGRPLAGAHLEYASNPPPAYPSRAMRDGETGTVVLEVLVGVDGHPLEVTISRSSGHRELDLAAKRQVLAHWTFKPAMRNGQPVQAIGLVPVEFSLQ
jgi:protein TonB